MSDLWGEISPSDHPGLNNVRRVEAAHPLDFWRGRDYQGRYIFVLEGSCSREQIAAVPKLSQIDIDISFSEPDACRLGLTLLHSSHREVFQTLCADLLRTTASLADDDKRTGIPTVIARLFKWQELLRRRQDRLLTESEILGLYGELSFLRDCVFPKLGLSAIDTWRGAFGEEQDFVYRDWTIEIKTQLSTSDKMFNISSAEQLDTSSGPILLVHQRVAPSAFDEPSAFSLNHVVRQIRELASPSTELTMALELALIEYGYVERPEYGDTGYKLLSRTSYGVSEEFPRITPGMLATGIRRVSYCVGLDACARFELELDSALEQVFGR